MFVHACVIKSVSSIWMERRGGSSEYQIMACHVGQTPSPPAQIAITVAVCSSHLVISRKVIPCRRLCQIDLFATRYVSSPGANKCPPCLTLVIDHHGADSQDPPVTQTVLHIRPPSQNIVSLHFSHRERVPRRV